MSKEKRILDKYEKPILSNERKNRRKLFWKWTGLGDKKGWDYLQLLIIPFVLLIAGQIFTYQSNQQQEEIATDRYQQETLSDYFNQMSKLLLKWELGESNKEAEDIARARTLSTLQELNEQRKELLVMFLFKARLISRPGIVDLDGADLSSVNLSHSYLFKVDFGGANLNGADLTDAFLKYARLGQAQLENAKLNDATLIGAKLRGINLKGAKLIRADLSETTLYDANLVKANLEDSNLADIKLQNALYNEDTKFPRKFDFTNRQMYSISPQAQLQGVNLQGVILEDVDLHDANLTDADLSGTYLGGANLSGAKLNGANLNKTNLARANLTDSNLEGTNLDKAKNLDEAILCNTTMPDGSLSNRDCPVNGS